MLKLLNWCDRMITLLKKQGISFVDGMPVLPLSSIYSDIPMTIETYAHRNDIPDEIKSRSIIAYFDNDKNLLNRLFNIEREIVVLKQYGGICGFDLSPCITMLRPRQKLSILISALFNCYVAINGIKILINARTGDLATMSVIGSIPRGSNFISGELGCHKHMYKAYGKYQLKLTVEMVCPQILFVYGNLSKKDISYVCGNRKLVVIIYPGRRKKMMDNKKTVVLICDSGEYRKYALTEYLQLRGEMN